VTSFFVSAMQIFHDVSLSDERNAKRKEREKRAQTTDFYVNFLRHRSDKQAKVNSEGRLTAKLLS